MDAMVARILDAYYKASAQDLADGIAWYDTARATAEALVAGTSLTLAHGAGIIAALSPRVRWETNVRAAATIVHAALRSRDGKPKVAGFSANSNKAWRIANGENPHDVLGGPKVRAFFSNIMGDADAVTVDVWAARAAEGEINLKAPAGRRYSEIADAYRVAARAIGLSPMIMQACVWVYIRRTFGNDQMMFDWKIA